MLKYSEKIFRDFINFIPDAVFAIDLEGKVIIRNKTAEEFTGVKAADILGKGNYEYSIPFYGKRRPIIIDLVFIPVDEIKELYPYLEKKGDVVYGEAYTLHDRHGTGYMWGIAAPLYDSRGNIIGAIESVRDITDRKSTEEALKEREIQLNNIINCSPVSQFVIDKNHRIIYWNKALESISGIKSDEVIGTKDHWRAFYMEERPCLADLLVDGETEKIPGWYAGKYSKSRYLEDAYEATDLFIMGNRKKWLYFTAAVIRDTEGNITGAVETLEDITERKEAEEAILEANERFRSVLRAATGYAIIGTDIKGVINIFNDGAEKMLGYPADEIIGKATPVLFHDPAELEAYADKYGTGPGFEVLAEAASRETAFTDECTYICKNGSRLTVLLSITMVKNEAGENTGIVGISRDITAEKKLEQQLVHSQKMESIGLLAGGIAHDFNNLLTPILGYTDLLISSFDTRDTRLLKLHQISNAAMKAKDLTRRLLAFSRKQIIELKLVNLGDIIIQLETMLRRMITENILIETEIDPRLWPVRVDPGQIEQVIINLAVNAQDAMPDGGKLMFKVANSDIDESCILLYPEIIPGKYVTLTVSDTGTGIEQSVIDHIFEPFFTTKEQGKGTGLGLSMVYGIVKQHGGTISVSSEQGRGTVFNIIFPVAGIEEQDSAINLSFGGRDIPRGDETILVAEDNEIVRMLTCDMLANLGYKVLAAESPEKCMEIVRSYNRPVDLLLTDVIMPGMNGKELYEIIKSMRPGIKVLFMSGYTSNIIGQQGIIGDNVNFIQKPFSLQALSESIRKAIDSPHAVT
jgi:PAS domain S-box-containing protein